MGQGTGCVEMGADEGRRLDSSSTTSCACMWKVFPNREMNFVCFCTNRREREAEREESSLPTWTLCALHGIPRRRRSTYRMAAICHTKSTGCINTHQSRPTAAILVYRRQFPTLGRSPSPHSVFMYRIWNGRSSGFSLGHLVFFMIFGSFALRIFRAWGKVCTASGRSARGWRPVGEHGRLRRILGACTRQIHIVVHEDRTPRIIHRFLRLKGVGSVKRRVV